MTKIVIVGGVAGGASAAARLRRLNEKAQVILFERGDYISFANCGLPYYIGGEIKEKSSLTLQTPESFKARFNIDVRIKSEVIAINRNNKTVTVKNLTNSQTYEESYDKLILSTGAEPILPNIKGVTSKGVFTLRNIPDTYKIKDYLSENNPKNALVVGGGYIGIEMAENLTNAGLKVTILELGNQLISQLDFDMASEVHSYMEKNGVTLMLNNALKEIIELPKGLNVVLSNTSINADMVILAIGVKAESQLAKNAGLALNEKGGIITNNKMETSDENIYAIGDAAEVSDFITNQKAMIPLAGPANKQGRIVADNICGIKSTYNGTQGSAILKVFDLTIATTGINEKTAKRLNLNYDKSFTYSTNHASYYPGALSMSIKTIFEKTTGRILGVQITGFDGVDKRCDVFATAIRANMTAADLTTLELCYAPPYSSAKDPVNMAGYVIQNLLDGHVKNFHWHEVENLQKTQNATFLDIRNTTEYENGHIAGFKNIPVNELRNKLNELPKNKDVYVTCQVGLRGYIAARILSQNGFNVYNLSGGYRLYKAILGNNSSNNQATNIKNHNTFNNNIAHNALNNAPNNNLAEEVIIVDACGLQCPGPIVKLAETIKKATYGSIIEISTTDPAFDSDIAGYCRSTNNELISIKTHKGITIAKIRKSQNNLLATNNTKESNGKNFIIFSGDLDKAIASFIMANASAAMGRKVSMFFTFWGLNILRDEKAAKAKKDPLAKMFGAMMPKGSKKLGLSKMNMGGIGAKMIRHIMKTKNVSSLEDLIELSMKNGVELIACSMSMDVMGIKPEELISGVKAGGAAAMLAHAEESDMSLFI